jgi:molybdopterin-guanine dinucleotide biosynthesis protein A
MEGVGARNLTAFILAGGKSTRMGADKAFVSYDRRTLLAHALDLARSVTPDVRIVGSREKFAAYAPVVEDIFRDHGPLGGIHAALRASQTELNLMLAVDMPFVSSRFLEYLAGEARTMQSTVVVPRQPLCAIYRRNFADAAEAVLLAGRNKIDPVFAEVDTRTIEAEELERAGFSSALFRNLNTPQELLKQK